MTRKEIIALSIVIVIIITINLINYLQWQQNKKSISLIIEEGIRQISINEADAEEFETLPGIGPVMAQRIVQYRAQNGGFKELSELKRVKGIGDKLFNKIRPYIRL